MPTGWVHVILIKSLTMLICFSQSKMKVLFTTAVFAVAAIGGVVGIKCIPCSFGRSLDRQDGQCATAVDALYAVGDAVDGCGVPDMVVLM